MNGRRDSLDDVKAANTAAIAGAIENARKAGIAYYEADDCFVYAIYPDGRRVALEKIKPQADKPSDQAV